MKKLNKKQTSIIIEQVYLVKPKEVWRAITNKENMKLWYFTIDDFYLMEGRSFNFYEPGDTKKFHHHCVIKEIIPFKKFRHTWTYPEKSKGESMLTWIIEASKENTKVTLIHEGIESFVDGGVDFARENYVVGWNEILEKTLKDFLEN